jgi:hypothetical protein
METSEAIIPDHFPVGQMVKVMAPETSTYEPAGAGLQTANPVTSAKFPG